MDGSNKAGDAASSADLNKQLARLFVTYTQWLSTGPIDDPDWLRVETSEPKLSATEKAQLFKLFTRFKLHNQAHVFKGWPQLDPHQRQRLTEQLNEIDVQSLVNKYNIFTKPRPEEEIEPFSGSVFDPSTDTKQRKAWRAEGLRLLADGKIAVILLAGGQGTRLGSSRPKGMYDIGLPSKKSLFHVMAERLVRLRKLASALALDPSSVSIPWYIMTSESTMKPTAEFFKEHNYFGLPETDVIFFEQGQLPALEMKTGAIIMDSPGSVAMSPNGNGGLYAALRDSKVIDDMRRRGIQYVHVHGVDNVLVKPGDPTMMGCLATNQLEVLNKCIEKRDASERTGVMCIRKQGDHRLASIVEYSELSPSRASQRHPHTNELLYNMANIANHAFTFDFVERCVARCEELPWHVAKKKVAWYDFKTKELIQPKTENAFKQEMFVFDVFHWASDPSKVAVFVTQRWEEFAPVKNADGFRVADSPQTARWISSELARQRLLAAGAQLYRIKTKKEEQLNPKAAEEAEKAKKYLKRESAELNALMKQDPAIPEDKLRELGEAASRLVPVVDSHLPSIDDAEIDIEIRESCLAEISPLLAYDGEGLEMAVSGKAFILPCNVDVSDANGI